MINFSVVIPIHNASDYISGTLQSVLSQSLLPIEVIIIDDFSNDSNEAFKKICAIKTDVVIKYIQHFENLNGSAARNTGIINSEGDYIAFLDADDSWEKDKLEKVRNFIISKRSKPKVIFNQAQIINEEGANKSIRPYRYNSNYIPDFLFIERGFIQTSCIVISKGLNVLFDENIKRHQDFQFCIDLCQYYDFYFISLPLTNYLSSSKGQLRSKESSLFSLTWIEGNKKNISSDSYHGYKAIALSAKYMNEGRVFYGAYNFLVNFSKLTFKNKVKMIYAIFKK